jgi:hypothetical protein
MLNRCSVCQARHPESEDCIDPGEEGYINRKELLDAFRLGYAVCLPCQSVRHRDLGDPARCPDCGGPWEQFGEDDLP